MSLKGYLARGMSGRRKKTVVIEAAADRLEMIQLGIIPLDPVQEEGVEPTNTILNSSVEQMNVFWRRDKEMIREADVIFDMTPELNSEGVKHEIGYGRYYLWKPIIRVYRDGNTPSPGSVAYFEDDVIAGSIAEACAKAHLYWGTWFKRFKWRIAMYKRCRLKALEHEVRGWL